MSSAVTPRAARASLRWLLLFSLLGACQSIIGVKDYDLVDKSDGGEPDASDDQDGSMFVDDDAGTRPSERQCTEYCDTVAAGCPDSKKLTAFADQSYCMATCRQYVSAPGQLMGSTLECRLDQARKALSVVNVPAREGASNCLRASPGGEGQCGSNCENYCRLWSRACAGQDAGVPDPDCVSKCGKLRSEDDVDQSAAFMSGSNTVQCRLAHLAAGAFQPDPHCQHSALDSATGPCNPRESKCIDYCTVLMNNCSDADHKQYDTLPECMDMCQRGLDIVTGDPTSVRETEDSVSCRNYHALNSLTLSNLDHCHHAGPGGDGHCGNVCPAYCKLTKKICGAAFDAKFPTSAACESNCATLVGTSELAKQADYKYSVSPAKQEVPINCRIYHAVKALSNQAECAAALGGAPCK